MEWIERIRQTTRHFSEHFGALDPAQMNWKPDAQTWSIAQNIQHLIVVNETYFPIWEALREGTYAPPFPSRLGFWVSWMGRTVLNAVHPGRDRKMKTFPLWEPGSDEIPAGILSRFEAHQKELCTYIEGSEDWIRNGIVIASPANRLIVYKLETAFDVIVSHEQRHLEQAREVLQAMTRG